MKPKAFRKPLLALVLGVLALGTAGCQFFGHKTPVIPPPGLIYSDVKAPLTVNYHGTPVGSAASKSGSKKTKYLWIPIPFVPLRFGWDEAEVSTIARENGITEIAYADYQIMSILGIYQEFTVQVYGN